MRNTSCLCAWKSRPMLGVGFRLGYTMIFDQRMMLPLYAKQTEPTIQICPYLSTQPLAFAVNTGTFVQLERSGEETVKMMMEGAKMLPYGNEAFVAVNSDCALLMDDVERKRAFYLLDGDKEAMRPDELKDGEILVKTRKRGVAPVHRHTGFEVICAAKCGNTFASCDECGFINFWRLN
ncbi:CAMK family protein kinase [Histomonas meleagridis]|uniref:CAMK family protein kinase n=1 Tax=Histomonas meleagridis TaxID=135588 RepID=UPI003559711B|nr:CAMK family protein kinase [Histomonas meleagridis]KAH0797176.1 CAMK family protein kinase [Histomonas meleagridis]